MRKMGTAILTICLAALWPRAGQAEDMPSYRYLGPAVPSRPNGYHYAYAPTILHEDGVWHMLYCSSGRSGAWDWIRYAQSADGRSWSGPEIVLTVSDPRGERAACDPSLVRYQAPGDARPFYYLFYSGAPEGVGTAMFVARAERIEGPYAKWTGTDWVPDAPDPQPIIRPATSYPDRSGFYGAGQQSVVVRAGRLQAWFTDDTSCTQPCNRIFASETTDPTRWPARRPTNLDGQSSVDATYDAPSRRFILYAIGRPHTSGSHLLRFRSADGVTWSEPEIVARPTTFTRFAHNLGIARDARGHALPGDTLVVFGAPPDATCGVCWARWDLRAGLVRE